MWLLRGLGIGVRLGLGELVGDRGHTDSSRALLVAIRGGSMCFRAWEGGGLTLLPPPLIPEEQSIFPVWHKGDAGVA